MWDPIWNSEVEKIFDVLRQKVEENQIYGLEEFPFENVGHVYYNLNMVLIHCDLTNQKNQNSS